MYTKAKLAHTNGRRTLYAAVASVFCGLGGPLDARPSLAFNFSNGTVVSKDGSVVPTFTRATTKTQTDWEGKPSTALSGEVVFEGLRRVRTYTINSGLPGALGVTTPTGWTRPSGTGTWTLETASVDGSTHQADHQIAAAQRPYISQSVVTVVAGDIVAMSMIVESCPTPPGGNILGQAGTTVVDLFAGPTLTGPYPKRVCRIFTVTVGGTLQSRFGIGVDGNSTGEMTISHPQIEVLTGSSNIFPSEYVSNGIVSTPFHGAKVDGVKYFPYLNGNTVVSGVVTEATGPAIPKRTGLGIGWVPGLVNSDFSTPDSVSNSITGDIDVRCWVAMSSWTPASISTFVSKFGNAANLSWIFDCNIAGTLRFTVSIDGTATFSATSSVAVGYAAGTAHWVRATRASATGTVTFYTSDDGVTWAQLGTTQATTAGAIFDSTITVEVGARNSALAAPLLGNVYRAQIYNGINGTLVADFNPTNWSTGTTFVAPTGETWTLNGGAKINKWANGYYGEVAGTNLVLQSEDFSTTWVAVGTPTRTGNAKQCGNIKLDLIGDDDAAAIEGYTQVVTFTGDGVKARAFYFSQGTSASSVARIRDTTAAADRLLLAVTWVNGIPTVTMTTGTLIGVFPKANGVWRVEVLVATVTAANVNQLEVYPATDAALAVANTGTIYWGGEQAENSAARASSYIPTTTTTVTRNLDSLRVLSLGTWYNALAGSLVAMATRGYEAVVDWVGVFTDGTANNRVGLSLSTVGAPTFGVVDTSVAQASIAGAVSGVGASVSIAAAWQANDFVLVTSGAVSGTDVAGTVPTVSELDIGALAQSSQLNSLISSLDYYPQRLSNAKLQSLTT